MTADEFDLARTMGKQAAAMVWPTHDRELIQRVVSKNKDVEAEAKSFVAIQEAEAALKRNPRDAVAARLVGKYLCCEKGNWEKGLPLLAHCGNPALKAMAEADLLGPTTAAEQLKLGNACGAVPDRRRAAYWYEKAMPALTTLERDRLAAMVMREPLRRRTVDLLAWVGAERDDADGRWGKWARNGADVTCISFAADRRQTGRLRHFGLPVEVDGQYDLLVFFTRDKAGGPKRDEIVVDFPVGPRNSLRDRRVGQRVGNIDGQNCYLNATTTTAARLVDGRRSALVLKVRHIGDLATIDIASGRPAHHPLARRRVVAEHAQSLHPAGPGPAAAVFLVPCVPWQPSIAPSCGWSPARRNWLE